VRSAAVATLVVLALAGCSGGSGDGVLSIDEAANRYSEGVEEMTIRGALVIQYGRPMLCDLAGSSHPQCDRGYWVEGTLPTVDLRSEGGVQWVDEVTLHGVLDEGVFTIAR
jgi:hypothetical protein